MSQSDGGVPGRLIAATVRAALALAAGNAEHGLAPRTVWLVGEALDALAQSGRPDLMCWMRTWPIEPWDLSSN